ncbi:unnamed protein product [Microthlaspi erraticum]|uniref:Reverse transcriptase Ty1/copia-type domain-containing protein n=1 Tax=Microthlaspi erraticum TaxID=1685480 RepID=A0A6D2IPR5_9BRAS|nr:unnamed protein product [Microthlaspi erraticum]
MVTEGATSKDKKYVLQLKALLSSEFEMKDLGEAKKILGMEITRDRVKGTLTISQESYVNRILGNFGMDQSKSVSTPMGAHFSFQAATVNGDGKGSISKRSWESDDDRHMIYL